MIEIKTKRLLITPMTENEMLLLVNQYKATVPELSAAYKEMLNNCISYPEQYVWYSCWKICLIEKNKAVGYIGFKGFNNGIPEIGYGVDEDYQGHGYAAEAVNAMCKWAFQTQNAVAIEAETEADNTKSQRVLEKSGFIKSGDVGAEGPRYVLKL